jgi:hypothetical protein
MLSVFSLASKGIYLSYSLHRPTFAFNVLCFLADAFNVFAVASLIWLSHVNHDRTLQWLVAPFASSAASFSSVLLSGIGWSWLFKQVFDCSPFNPHSIQGTLML